LFRVSIFGIRFFIDEAFGLVKDGNKSKDPKKQILLKKTTESFRDKLDLMNAG